MEGQQNISISGTGKINGGRFREVSISGIGQILGDVEADRIEISGMGTVKGRAKMQRFLINGNRTVEGELDKLTTEVLEGTIINISSTNAKIVRGHDVRIGPGCNIGEVEYSGKLEVDAQAVVSKQTKII